MQSRGQIYDVRQVDYYIHTDNSQRTSHAPQKLVSRNQSQNGFENNAINTSQGNVGELHSVRQSERSNSRRVSNTSMFQSQQMFNKKQSKVVHVPIVYTNLKPSTSYASIPREENVSQTKFTYDLQIKKGVSSKTATKKESNSALGGPQIQIQQQQQMQKMTSARGSTAPTGSNQNIKSRDLASKAILQPKIVQSTYRPSTAQTNQSSMMQAPMQQQAQSSQIMSSFDNNKKVIKTTQSIQSVEKQNRARKRISEMTSPGSKPQKSPRITLTTGSLHGGTSMYSMVTTESIINQSGSNTNTNNRKMCLSEKLAPKSKKKKNAHKQPKQITITRDQIILQPFLSIYSTQNGGLSGLTSGQQTNFNTNHDMQRVNASQNNHYQPAHQVNTSIHSSVQMQMLESKKDIESTPMTRYDMMSDDMDFMSQYNRNISHKDLFNNSLKQGGPVFQFNANENCGGANTCTNKIDSLSDHYNQHESNTQDYNNINLLEAKSSLEEAKEVTGIFGTQFVETLGNEGTNTHSRPSLDAQERKASSKDVHTPVFHHNDGQGSKRPSEVVLHLDVQLCDDSPLNGQRRENNKTVDNQNLLELQQLNQSRVKSQSSAQNQPQQIMSSIQNQENTTIFNNIILNDFQSDDTQSLHNQTMKKIQSASNLEISRGNISVAQTSVMQRNNSNGSFFSRIKNYFGGKPQSQVIDLRRNDVEYRCRCGQSGRPYACSKAMKWLQFANNYSEIEYEKNRQLYLGLLKFNTASGSETQIERDIPRTFPNADPYMSSAEGQQKLSRVLNAFSKYFTSIGYVQGMNFIVGALLMHCSEDIAFWLFVSLIEDYEMRDIYQPKLPGLYKHSQVLQLLQMEHLEKLYYHFSSQNILIEMYASDWVFALFSNIIPITEYHHFLDKFFVGGWTFFYKFSLTFLKCHQEEVLDLYDLSEILNMIKLKNVKKDFTDNKSLLIRFDESGQISELDGMKRYSDTSSISPTRQTGSVTRKGGLLSRMFGKEAPINSESFKDDTIWEKVINLSCKEWENEFNENFVNQLLSSFDPDKLVFNQSFPTTPKEVSVVYSAKKSSNKMEINLTLDPSPPPKYKKPVDKKQHIEKVQGVQKKQSKQEPKLQIIVNENGIRNPRQSNLVFMESSRSSMHSKQTRSQQTRENKHKQTQQKQVTRYAP